MTETTPITIQVDADALRAQVQGIIAYEMKEASFRLRAAADAMYPDFYKEQTTWMEIEIQSRAERLLAEREGPTDE